MKPFSRQNSFSSGATLRLFIALRTLTAVILIRGVSTALIWLGPAAAETTAQQPVFGPKQYVGTTGSPNRYVDSFSLPSSIRAPFLLHVVNGDPKGGHRVSGASVELNGVEVL